MTTITTRAGKGSPLSNTECDNNFLNLNTAKLELGQAQSSGTANGVLYLNGSKQPASGSALTFDGTTLSSTLLSSTALSVSANASAINLTNASYGQVVSTNTLILDTSAGDILFRPSATEQMRLTSTGLGIGTSSPAKKLDVVGTGWFRGDGIIEIRGGNTIEQVAGGQNLTLSSPYGPMLFSTNSSEKMRLDSSGNLGIGTSSPTSKLDIRVASSTNGVALSYEGTVNSEWYANGTSVLFGTSSNHPVIFRTNNTERARIDASGNLGLGVTPSGWNNSYGKAFQFGGGRTGALWNNTLTTGETTLTNNCYFDGSWKYVDTTLASKYVLNGDAGNGTHAWYTAPSGTAGNPISFTQAMTLDASGNLLVGTTTSNGLFTVKNPNVSGDQVIYAVQGATNTSRLLSWTLNQTTDVSSFGTDYGGALAFKTNNTERARIDSSGNLGIGALAGAFNQVVNAPHMVVGTGANTAPGLTLFGSAGSAPIIAFANGTSGNQQYRGFIQYDHSVGAMVFATAATERARIDSSGNLLVGTTTNTNSSKLVVNGTISETVSSTQYLVASQADIGTAPNEVPLNQYLGNLAYQDASSIAGQVGLSAGSAALPALVSATNTATGVWFPAANTLAASTGGTERMRLDSSGNLGLGVTPSAWWAAMKAIDISSRSAVLAGGAAQPIIAYNWYVDASQNYIYKTSNYASQYEQFSGQHRWYTAPSGTAGAAISFTQAMTLDASGNLGVGTSSYSQKLAINSANTSTNCLIEFKQGDVTQGYAGFGQDNTLRLQNTGSQPIGIQTVGAGHVFISTSNVERARIDSSGNLLVGKTSATSNGGDVQVSKGITFPATQVACSDANTLDDYEEGTFTPNQGSGITVNSGTFYASGRYTKIGRVVSVQLLVAASQITIAAQGIVCTNLPFPVNGTSYQACSAINWGYNQSNGGMALSGTSSLYCAEAFTLVEGAYFNVTYTTST